MLCKYFFWIWIRYCVTCTRTSVAGWFWGSVWGLKVLVHTLNKNRKQYTVINYTFVGSQTILSDLAHNFRNSQILYITIFNAEIVCVVKSEWIVYWTHQKFTKLIRVFQIKLFLLIFVRIVILLQEALL